MKVQIAKSSGFCFGVKRAIIAAEEQLARPERFYMLGPIIHHPQVVADFEERGVRVVETPDACEDGAILIRSHGVAPHVLSQCQEKGLRVIDATCPYVKRVQETAFSHWRDGYTIVILGRAEHPEVIGINGWCGNEAIVIETMEQTRALGALGRICVVAQTTFDVALWNAILPVLAEKARECQAVNTICSTTAERQMEAKALASCADMMLVIGGKNSHNTKKLFEICAAVCPRTYAVEDAADIPLHDIRKEDTIGIVAGASTPDGIIKEVLMTMDEQDRKDILEDVAAESVVAETSSEATAEPQEAVQAEAASEAAPQNAGSDGESSFAEDFEKTLVTIRNGQVITGTVVQVNENEVCVNIGYKSDGFIPRNEMPVDEKTNLVDAVKVGDTIEVEVIKVNDGEGNVLLSKKNVDAKKNWFVLLEKIEAEQLVEGIGKEVVKGGLIAFVMGVRAFIPASQLAIGYVKNIESFVGKTMMLKIIEVDRSRHRIVASHRAVLQEEADRKKKQVWGAIQAGQEMEGVVRRLTDFGAFVDIGGVDGLVHVTDLSWGRVRHPSDVLQPEEKIKVLVLSVDSEKERIALGYKQLQPKPWDLAPVKYPAGSITEGKVVRIVSFGAFVELEPGLDGLVHISQVAPRRIEKVEDVLKVGDIVSVKILDVNPDERRISLSIREALPQEEASADVVEEIVVEARSDQSVATIGDAFAAAQEATAAQETQTEEEKAIVE